MILLLILGIWLLPPVVSAGLIYALMEKGESVKHCVYKMDIEVATILTCIPVVGWFGLGMLIVSIAWYKIQDFTK